jgi:hypothetical protein
MLNIGSNKGPEKPVDVTAGRRGKAPFMKGKERARLFTAVLGLLLVLLVAGPVILQQLQSPTGGPGQQGDPLAVPDMAFPSLDGAPALPGVDQIAKWQDQIDHFLADPNAIFGRIDAAIIGWMRAQLAIDEEQPASFPLRLSSDDLSKAVIDAQYRPRTGERVLLAGTLVDRADAPITGGETWSWQLLEAAPGRYALVLTRGEADVLELGRPVTLVGRLIGTLPLPVDASGDAEAGAVQEVLVVGATRGSHRDEQKTVVTSLLGLEDPDDEQRAFIRDDSILADADETALRLELRPYYYLLGLVLRDRTTPGVYDEAGPVTAAEADLHYNPQDQRGRPFTISGRVQHAWEDHIVSMDQPFGVSRVFRIWLWNYAQIQEEYEEGGETRQRNQRVLGVYEIAAIVGPDAVLPEPRSWVEATGRFLKTQRYQVAPEYILNRANTERLSDSSYTKLLVTDGFRATPPEKPVSMLPFIIGYVTVIISLIIFMMVLVARDRAKADDYKAPVRKLRASRRRLNKEGRLHPQAEGDSAADAAETTGEPSEADDPESTAGVSDSPEQ